MLCRYTVANAVVLICLGRIGTRRPRRLLIIIVVVVTGEYIPRYVVLYYYFYVIMRWLWTTRFVWLCNDKLCARFVLIKYNTTNEKIGKTYFGRFWYHHRLTVLYYFSVESVRLFCTFPKMYKTYYIIVVGWVRYNNIYKYNRQSISFDAESDTIF